MLGYAQQTMTISNGLKRNGIEETIPFRDVENIKDAVEVTYQFNNVIVQDDPDFTNCKLLKIDGFALNDAEAEPAVLYRRDYVAVPKGYTASVSVTNSEYEEYPFEIGSSLPPVVDSSSQPLYQRRAIAPYSGFFPQKVVSKESENNVRGNRIAVLCVSPLQYDTQNRRTRIYKTITYRVDFIRDDSQSNAPGLSYAEDDDLFLGLTVNGTTGNKNVKVNSFGLSKAPGYLILTTNKFLPAAKKLAEWRKLTGFNVEIVSEDDWSVSAVMFTVIDKNKEIDNLRYLLIIGDYEDVPAKTSSVGCEDGNNVHKRITDYYYGFTDIGPHNAIYEMNRMPDLYRGRLSVKSLDEADKMIDKIINYERTPSMDDSFYQNCAHLAYFQDSADEEKNIERDGYEDRRFVKTSEDIRDYIRSKGKNPERIYFAYSYVNPTNWNKGNYSNGEAICQELRKPTFTWDGSSSDIINAFNGGKHYILYRGHGSAYSWDQPSFSTWSFSNLNNCEKLPVVFSVACLTGKFDENNCFAELLSKKHDGGAVAVIAATEVSYSGFNDGLACGFFDAIWPTPGLRPVFPSHSYSDIDASTPKYRLGQILDRGCLFMDQAWGQSPILRLYTKEVFHLFGDPAMPVWTELPVPFEGISVNRGPSTVTITKSNQEGIIAIYDSSVNKVMTSDGMKIEYQCQDSSKVSVSVTASNRIPFFDLSYGDDEVFIQNEKLSFSKNISGKKISIGSSVSDQKEEGNVLFEKGKYVISGDEIFIGPGTTIEKGTEVEFKNR